MPETTDPSRTTTTPDHDTEPAEIRHPQQPDGIDDDSRDLPDVARSARRVRAFISEWGDGLITTANRRPLYARDLEALRRAGENLADLRAQYDRARDGLSHQRDQLTAERDQLTAERDQAIADAQQIADTNDRLRTDLAAANQRIADLGRAGASVPPARAQVVCVLSPDRPASDVVGDIDPARVLAVLKVMGWPDDRTASAHVEADGWQVTGVAHYWSLAEDLLRAADQAAPEPIAEPPTVIAARIAAHSAQDLTEWDLVQDYGVTWRDAPCVLGLIQSATVAVSWPDPSDEGDGWERDQITRQAIALDLTRLAGDHDTLAAWMSAHGLPPLPSPPAMLRAVANLIGGPTDVEDEELP